MKARSTVVVERMPDLGDWELYRFADEETDDVACRIALRPDGSSEIEYGVWRKEEAEPSATGSLDLEGGEAWGDEAREQALGAIARIYEDRLPETADGLDFRIDESEGDEDEEDEEDHESDEEEEEEEDDDIDEDEGP